MLYDDKQIYKLPTIQINVSANNFHTFYVMDMCLAYELHDYYYYHEKYFEICNKRKNELVFLGPIELNWGDNFIKIPIEGEKRRIFMDLATKILDYKNLYGMVPFKIINKKKENMANEYKNSTSEVDNNNNKKKTTTNIDDKEIMIPEMGTGKFIYKKEINNEITVHFLSFNKPNSAPKISKNIHVFVWPGYEPSLLSNKFKSGVYKLYLNYLKLSEIEENILDADYNLTHPPLITKQKVDQLNSIKYDQLTEDEVFADSSLNKELNPRQNITYKRNKYFQVISKEMSNTSNTSGNTRDFKKSLNIHTGKITLQKRTRYFEGNQKILAIGEEIEKQQLPEYDIDLYFRFKESYQEDICHAIGVPVATTRSRTTLKATVEDEQSLLESTISGAREDVAMFFETAYELMYKKNQDKWLANLITNIELKLNSLLKLKSEYRLRKGEEITEFLNTNIEENEKLIEKLNLAKLGFDNIIEYSNKIKLIFTENPFKNNIDHTYISDLADRDIITSFEEANIERQKYGLVPFRENDPQIKKIEKSRNLRKLNGNKNSSQSSLQKNKNTIDKGGKNEKTEKQESKKRKLNSEKE